MKNPLLLLIFACFCNLTFAQTTLHPDLTEEEQEKVLISLKDKYAGVDLTDQQFDILIDNLVETIKYVSKVAELNENPNQEMKDEMQNKMMDLEDKFAETLTPEQEQQFNDHQIKVVEAKQGHQKFVEELYTKGINFRALRHEIAEKEIAPTIRAQRFKLEELLAEKDKAEIEKIKRDAEQQKEADFELSFRPHKAFRKMNPLPENPTSEDVKAYNERMNEFQTTESYKKQMEAINNSAEMKVLEEEYESIRNRKENLAIKYSTEITGLMDEIKPQREDWHKRIWDNYRTIFRDSPLRKLNDDKFWRKYTRMYRFYEDNYDTQSWHIEFLLIDPVSDYAWLDKKENEKLDARSVTTSHAFPNPAITVQTLEFNTQQNGNVVIEIVDSKGTIFKTIFNENKEIGKHQLKVDVSSLLPGNYFYQITSTTGISSVKFIKSK